MGCCLDGAFDWRHVWCMRTHGCVFSAAHHVLGTRLSWCMSSVVASQTNCRQVESCSLRGTASIFLALWITSDPQGQTMEASKSKSIKRLVGSCWQSTHPCLVIADSIDFPSYWCLGLSRIFLLKSHLEWRPPHETHFSLYP